MKAVLISIRPEWCDKIASGEKTIEIRKNKPNIEPPFKCYIYETKAINRKKIIVYLDGELPTIYARGRGKVIGEFICDRIEYMDMDSVGVGFWKNNSFNYIADLGWNTGLTLGEFINYTEGKRIYGWHISNLVIYNKPKKLSEFFIIDKKAVKECSLRERIYTNPDYTNGAYLPGTFICNKVRGEIDFCRGGCWKKSLTRPPQSWCYVEEVSE